MSNLGRCETPRELRDLSEIPTSRTWGTSLAILPFYEGDENDGRGVFTYEI